MQIWWPGKWKIRIRRLRSCAGRYCSIYECARLITSALRFAI